MFEIDPAFVATSELIGDLPLCQARLQSDARFAWIVLVPRVEDARELEDLSAADRARLMDEILAAGRAVRAIGEAFGRPVEKLNIGALGNVTSQLHVHVVGRRRDDPAWPGPVWGFAGGGPYETDPAALAVATAKAALGL